MSPPATTRDRGVVRSSALVPDPDAGRSLVTDAAGSRQLGELLDALDPACLRVLHDRHTPSGAGDIDHLAVTAAGIWVIDARRCSGLTAFERAIGADGVERLVVNERCATTLLGQLGRQVELVRAALDPEDAAVEVRGALCFVDTELRLRQREVEVAGCTITWPRALKRVLQEPGPVDSGARHRLLRHLARAFPG